MSFSGARRPCTPRTRGWSQSSASSVAFKKASLASSPTKASAEGWSGQSLRRANSHGASNGYNKRSSPKASSSRPSSRVQVSSSPSSPKSPKHNKSPPETFETNGLYTVPQKAMSRSRLDSCGSAPSIRRTGSFLDDGDVAIKVCVRIRPLSAMEKSSGDTNVTLCEGDCGGSLQMMHPSDLSEESVDTGQGLYSFDWVLSEACSQPKVYELLGQRVVLAVADGFHGCIFAHGQTGSGKSHTIFGSQEEEGLLPRICDGLFSELEDGEAEYIVRLSYLEIYNERLRDLLVPAVDNVQDLQVRKHPKFGVFVEGLSSNVVQTAADVKRLLDFGHKIRVVGRTNMNAASSRSHAVVTLHVALRFPREVPDDSGVPVGGTIRRHAQLHVIDLAGSERMKQVGIQRRNETTSETKQINKSLWALSLMISSLAEQQLNNSSSSYVPYRNSKLTHILSDSLMGNCRTAMVACISPGASAFGISISTLRFAASAKKIKTRPVKNEELEGTLISNLRAEIESLRQQLSKVNSDQKKDLVEQLATTQYLEEEFSFVHSCSWAEKKAQAVQFDSAREMTLERLGLSNRSIAEAWRRGNGSVFSLMHTDADPYLVNVCDDPLLSGCLTYVLPQGEVVSVGSHPSCKIQIEGLGVQPEMCHLVNEDGENVQVHIVNPGFGDLNDSARQPSPGRQISEGRSRSDSNDIGFENSTIHERRTAKTRRGSLYKTGVSQVFIRNSLILNSAQLRSGERLRIGRTHVFQLFIPRELDVPDSPIPMCKMSSLTEQVLFEEYATHLKERLGPARAQDVFSRLQDLQQLVDEANEITAELRGGDNREYEFKAHILTDVSSADKDPSLAVILSQTEKVVDISTSGQSIFDRRGSFQEDSIAVWSEQKFRQRLEVMRDLHTEIECRDLPWGLASDLDPWRDDAGVQPVGAPLRPGQHSPNRSPVSGSRPSASEPDAEPRGQLYDERLANLQADLQQTRARLADAQVQLQQLSDQSKTSRASAEEAQSKLQTVEKELRRLAADRSDGQIESQTRGLRLTPGFQSRQPDEDALRHSLAGSCRTSPGFSPSTASFSGMVHGGSFEARAPSRSLSPRIHHPGSLLATSSMSLPVASFVERQPSFGSQSSWQPALQQTRSQNRIVAGPPRSSTTIPTQQSQYEVSPTSSRRVVSPVTRVVASHKAVSPAALVMPTRVTTPVRSLTPSRYAQVQTSPTAQSPARKKKQVQNEITQQLQNELTNIRQELQSLEALCQNPDLELPPMERSQKIGVESDAIFD